MENKELHRIGRKLSYLLRHDKDIPMDDNGWVDVLVILSELGVNMTVLNDIVETNNKKRYSYNYNKSAIRANQGHSVSVDVELKETVPPVILYHGTSPLFVDSILKMGLNKMKRQHVHLSSDLDTAMDVGERHSKNKDPEVLIIDCKSMIKDGFKFYISANGVWLTDNIPPKYLSLWE